MVRFRISFLAVCFLICVSSFFSLNLFSFLYKDSYILLGILSCFPPILGMELALAPRLPWGEEVLPCLSQLGALCS